MSEQDLWRQSDGELKAKLPHVNPDKARIGPPYETNATRELAKRQNLGYRLQRALRLAAEALRRP